MLNSCIISQVEEAVQDVKRAAMTELQRALAAERTRADRLVAEARRQGADETLLVLGRHSQAKEVVGVALTLTLIELSANSNFNLIRFRANAGLLELRTTGQRDVQWLQNCPLLQHLLPAQALGNPPQDLRPSVAADSGHRSAIHRQRQRT